MSKKKTSAKLNSVEAVYGFAAWLTTRSEVTVMSSGHDSAPVADRVREFVTANGLGEPSESWPDNLVFPIVKITGGE